MEMSTLARGNPVAEARALTGLAIEDFAPLAEMGKNTLWRLENGIGRVKRGSVYQVVDALHKLAADQSRVISDSDRATLAAITVEELTAALEKWQPEKESDT